MREILLDTVEARFLLAVTPISIGTPQHFLAMLPNRNGKPLKKRKRSGRRDGQKVQARRRYPKAFGIEELKKLYLAYATLFFDLQPTSTPEQENPAPEPQNPAPEPQNSAQERSHSPETIIDLVSDSEAETIILSQDTHQ